MGGWGPRKQQSLQLQFPTLGTLARMASTKSDHDLTGIPTGLTLVIVQRHGLLQTLGDDNAILDVLNRDGITAFIPT